MIFGWLICQSNYDLKKKPVPAKSELPQKTTHRKIMWSQFPPNLSWLKKQSTGKQCGASSRQIWAASKTIHRKIMWMWSQFPPNLSCLQNNPPENNVEPVPAKSELPPKIIHWKKMLSQFPPNLSCLQNNRPENKLVPVPAKSELPPKTICRRIMWSQFLPNLSCLQNNPPENNVEPVPAKRTAGYLRFGGN